MDPSPSPAPTLEPPWSRAEAVAFDRHLQEDLRLPAALLMENAGAALARLVRILARRLRVGRIGFVVGPGNNGGDALVAARQLHGMPGLEPLLAAPLGRPARPGSPATGALEAALALGLPVPEEPVEALLRRQPGLLVDGLFGVGLSRPLEGPARQAVAAMAASALPVLAVDLPSGLDSDTGRVLGCIAPARWTLSFVAPKEGFTRAAGPACCGRVLVADIGVSRGYARTWRAARRAAVASAPEGAGPTGG